MDRSNFIQDLLIGIRRPAGKDYDAPTIEGALHDMAHPVRSSPNGDAFFLIDFARGILLDVGARQFDLDNMGSQLGSDLRRVSRDVDSGFALLTQAGTPRIRPDNDGQTISFGLFSVGKNLLLHLKSMGRARVDGETNR